MQVLNPNYELENNKNENLRVFTIQFEGQDTIYSNYNILGTTLTVKKYLTSLPDLGSDEIDIIEGTNTISALRFDLNDVNNEVTQFLTNNTILAKEVTVKTGFDNIDFADYITVFKGNILYYSYNTETMTWTFEIGDRLRKLKTNLFLDKYKYFRSNTDYYLYKYNLERYNEVYIDIQYGLEILNIEVNGDIIKLTTFKEALTYNGQRVILFESGNLITKFCTVKSMEIVNPTQQIWTLESGELNEYINDLQVGDTFRVMNIESLYIKGNMLDFLDFLLANEIGLKEGTEYDRDSIIDIRDTYLSFVDIDFLIKKVESNAKEFIEKEIFKITQTHLIITNDGILKLIITRPPMAGDNIVVFSDKEEDGNIVGLPEYELNPDKIINQVIIYYNYNNETNQFDNENYYLQAVSIDKYGEFPALKIENRLIANNNNIEYTLNGLVQILFLKHAEPQPVITFRTHTKYRYLEVGDAIILNSRILPNLETGNKILENKVYEIINKKLDDNTGQLQFTVFDTHYAFGNALKGYADDTILNWDDETVENRASFGFYTDDTGLIENDDTNTYG